MAGRGQAITPVLAALALCVAMLGAWTVYAETANDNFEPGRSSIARVVHSLDHDATGGQWTRTQHSLLEHCERTLRSTNALEMRYLPTETQQALAPHCHRLALNATASFPTDAYAWSISALAAAELQHWPAMNAALVRSHLTGPTEAWVATVRLSLAEDNFVRLDAAARRAAEQDLRLLLISAIGIPALLQRYIGDAEFRQRVESQLQTMAPDIQQRFVTALRQQMS